jgi:hypothetical protein
MQTLQVMTEIEKPGIVTVQAFSEVGFERQNAAVGFFVRRRRHGDQFKLANWKEFSPRWMKFVDEPPKEWREKIEAKFGKDSVSMAKGFDRIEETVEQLSMAQAGRPREAGNFDFANGRVKK